MGGTRKGGSRPKRRARRRPRRPAAWIRYGKNFLALVLVGAAAGVLAYRTLSQQLDARLAAGLTPPPAMVFATPLELAPGLGLDRAGLADRLDELGYARRDVARRAGEYAVEPDALTLIPREGPQEGRLARVRFTPAGGDRGHVAAIESPPGRRTGRLALDAPHLSTLHGGDRRRRRTVPLAEMPEDVVRAVLAAEDHRFFDHPGIDAVRIAGAAVTNLTGNRSYLVGASTLTQQLIKNTLLSPEQTLWRKLREQGLALLLERRLPKPRILEMYLNEVYLGHRGSFAIHGVAQGARALFGKHLDNLTLGEAATMAGLIRAPQTHSPHRHPERARERRNGVLQAMVDLGLVTPDRAMVAARESLGGVVEPADGEAPYLVDFVRDRVADRVDDWRSGGRPLRIETTVDLHLQRLAEAAVRNGLDRIADRRGDGGADVAPQAALVAVDPRSGAIRAMVGGRSYPQSQFNRAVRARRQPGSVIKPFVYLTALERAAREPGVRFTPASVIDDRPTTFRFGGRPWRPTNYGGVYDGPVTARAALAHSRNVAAVKVGEVAGFGAVANLWAAASGGAVPPAYPSIVLGSFESTPLEVAAAYTVLANRGARAPLHAVSRIVAGDEVIQRTAPAPRPVARADNAFLVTSMLRSTLDIGTAASARRAGFVHDAAGKTGTSNDLRDAWFAGFTPTLLTVVWVGLDDNRPLGLTGGEAALPIWTDFMRRALAERTLPGFMPPPRVTLVDVCADTGLAAGAGCPRTIEGAFRTGTEPGARCREH